MAGLTARVAGAGACPCMGGYRTCTPTAGTYHPPHHVPGANTFPLQLRVCAAHALREVYMGSGVSRVGTPALMRACHLSFKRSPVKLPNAEQGKYRSLGAVGE